MKSRILIPVVTLILITIAFSAEATVLQANLSGEARTPDGKGRAILTIHGDEITYTLTWRGVDASPAESHIHRLNEGQPGAIVVDLDPAFDRSSGSGSVTADQALVDEIAENPAGFYVNLHFSFGTIGGPLFALTINEDSFTARMTGSTEIPGPGDDDGIGTAIVEIDGMTLNYTIQADRIQNPDAGHIHRGSALSSGEIFIDLQADFTNGTAQGSVTLDQDTRDALLENPENFYINLHNAEFPDGAIRGQLSNEWVLPVAGRVEGANQTNFITDVRILNRSQGDAVVRIDFYEQSMTGSEAATATRHIAVRALSQVVLNDILANLFDRQGLGAMTFVSDQEIVVAGRVLNDLRELDMGTNGLFIVAPPLREASIGGSFPFLSNATTDEIGAGFGFRTNVGFFNPGGQAINLTIRLFRSADGVLIGDRTIEIGPHQQQQAAVFDLVDEVPVEERGIEDFFATWSSTGPTFVYASITDNRTGDAMVLE